MQIILVFITVSLAFAYIIKRIYKSFLHKGEGCDGCAMNKIKGKIA